METQLTTLPNDNPIKLDLSELPITIGKTFDEVKRTDEKINKAIRAAQIARDTADKAKEKSAGWSWDGSKKKEAIEALQDSSKDLCDAQDALTDAMSQFFEGQKKLSEAIKYLFGLGVANMAANRMVVRELEKKLSGASKKELSDLARQEMLNVIKQLKAQEDLYNRVEKQKEGLVNLENNINSFKQECIGTLKQVSVLKKEVEQNQDNLNRSFAEQQKKSEEQIGQIDEQMKSKADNLRESINSALLMLKKEHNKEISILQEQHTKNIDKIKEEYAHLLLLQKEDFEQKIKLLRPKSFYNTNLFIVITMIIALVSVLASIYNFVIQ